MDSEQIKQTLRAYGLKPNFTYGQNFLIDEEVLDNIVDGAAIQQRDLVLEIGPGLGALTERLCRRAGLVLAVEKDPKFLPVLKKIKKDFPKNFRYLIGDILAVDFVRELAGLAGSPARTLSYKVAANIPYYITGKFLQLLLAAQPKPSGITLLTQKEVAQGIAAKAGDLSVLAISVQLFGRPRLIRTVPAASFYPAPKVDSAILQIEPYAEARYQVADEKFFFRVVKACFAGKRKQLHNTLENNLRLDKARVAEALRQLKIPAGIRPQELSIEQWVELSRKIEGI